MPPLPTADLDHVLEWTLPVWERLRDARLFITGGTGFFGTWLVESLAWAVDRLHIPLDAVILTRSPETFAHRHPQLAEHAALRLHPGDIRDFTFPDGRFTHVIHAAFPSGGPPLDAPETAALIMRGTERTLEFAHQSGVENLLFTSSGAVYGRQPVDLDAIPENYEGLADAIDPRSTYGEFKRRAERLCLDQGKQKGLAVTIARCFAFVGPHLPLDAHFAIGNFIRDALHGGPIRIRGDGRTVRSYLYAADLAVWLWTMLVAPEPGHNYNIGSPQPVSIAELARVVAREIAPGTVIEQERQPDLTVAPDRYVPDVTRAARELQLVPRIELTDAIRRTAAWHRLVPAVSEAAP